MKAERKSWRCDDQKLEGRLVDTTEYLQVSGKLNKKYTYKELFAKLNKGRGM